MRIGVGNHEEMALVDTGSAMPFLNARLVARGSGRTEGSRTVRSGFGTYELPVANLPSLRAGSREFHGAQVVVEDRGPPILGSSVLFQSGNILFSKEKTEFDVDEARLSASFCAPLIIDLLGSTYSSPVRRVYFRLEVDGVPQKVLFDTGRAETLVGTSSAPAPKSGWPRFELHGDFNGRTRLWRYYRERGHVRLGPELTSLAYKRFPSLDHIATPFVMGAGVLNTHSVFIEPRRGRACFIAR
jgi:hypothetical protein